MSEPAQAAEEPPHPPRVQHHYRRLAGSRRAQLLLVWLSFLEAVIVPIPLEAILVPYMQMRRDILWRLAGLALLGFVAASGLGYLIGALAFQTLGVMILDFFGWHDAFSRTQDLFSRYGFWALVGIGLLPIPSQVAMLAGGALAYPLGWFVLAMSLSRGVRYYGLALLVYLFGDRVTAAFGVMHRAARRHRRTALLIAGLIVLIMVLVGLYVIRGGGAA
ncbi:DedA family protein [Fodinicurvata sp. EGI_FJ10296]|uniref:YqaA family protein n=1 Tax=Fodinicurvata sp. EGI_FJ10296 TaxID=3231908 RepID=UPI0034544DA0